MRDVSFELEPGACLLVLGPSGSGKSTLALAIAGLVPRDLPATMTGTLAVDGIETRSARPGDLAARVGIVFQDPGSQLVMERVEDEVAFGLENRGWPPAAMVPRVRESIDDAGLAGLERRRSHRLSGGQQQRLALASVLAPRPGIVVLDEPTANLDPEGATALFDRLAAIRAARAATVVLIEHHVDAAWPLVDRVLALAPDGGVIDAGDPATVLARSRHELATAGIWLPRAAAEPVEPAEPAKRARPDDPDQPDQPDETDPRPLVSGPVSGPVSGGVIATADAVTFGYERDVPVLRDVDLTVCEGDRLALVGSNGSGKTTLGRLLVGLLRPTRGHVGLLGDDPSRMPPAVLARRAGYVFQDPEAGFLMDTVAAEIELGLTPAEAAAAPDLMARLGLPLERFGSRNPHRLSGGEARRLSLAATLIRRPVLLVLDEPTFGQDRRGYEELLEILRERLDDGAALVAATHDRRFVADVARRVVTVRDGRVGEGA